GSLTNSSRRRSKIVGDAAEPETTTSTAQPEWQRTPIAPGATTTSALVSPTPIWGDSIGENRGDWRRPVTTLADRPNTALLVIDVQNGVVEGSHNRDEMIANINKLVDKARAEDVPVIWVQHNNEGLPLNSEVWQYVPELERRDSEPLVHKTYGD